MAGEAELFFMGLALMGIGAVLGILVNFVWGRVFFPRRWPIDVLIYEKRGKDYITKIDYGAVIQKNEEFFKLFLKNQKEKTKPIPYEYMRAGSGGRSLVTLYSPNRAEYFAVSPKFNERDMEMPIIKDDNKYWFALAQREAEQKWKQPPSFMAQWGGLLLIGLIGVLMIAMIYFGGQHIVDMAYRGADTAKQAASDTQLIDQLKNLLAPSQAAAGGTTPSPVPPAPSPPAG